MQENLPQLIVPIKLERSEERLTSSGRVGGTGGVGASGRWVGEGRPSCGRSEEQSPLPEPT